MERTTSIRKRLIISLFLLSIVPLLILGVILSVHNFIIQQNQAIKFQGELSEKALNKILFVIHELEDELFLASKFSNLVKLDKDRQYSVLSEIRFFRDEWHKDIINEITLLDSKGHEQVKVSRDSVITAEDLKDQSHNPKFMVPAETKEVYYSPVNFQKETGEPFITMSLPLVNVRSGNMEGVLTTNIRLKFLWDLIAEISIGKSGTAYILDNNGNVVAHPNPSTVLRNTQFKLPEKSGITTGLNNTKVILSSRAFQLGGHNYFIVTELPVTEALTYSIHYLITMSVLILLSLSGAVMLGVIVVRRIIKPIESLSETAQKISEGDLTRQSDISSKDEIGILSKAFNAMTTHLTVTIDALEKEKDKLQKYLDIAAVMVVIIDINHKVLLINKKGCEVLGYGEAEIIGKNWFDNFLPERISSNVKSIFSKLIAGEIKPVEYYENAVLTKKGNERLIAWYNTLLTNEKGNIIGALSTGGDITEHKKTEELLKNIFETATVEIGEAFFQSLVIILAKTLNTKYAFIGKLFGEKQDKIKTLAVCVSGEIADNFEYDLADTPCENVIGKTACSYPNNVQQKFPKDHLLKEMGVKSYIGTPLFDAKKKPLGIMVVLDNRPMENVEPAKSIFNILAVCAASEIDRLNAEDQIKASLREKDFLLKEIHHRVKNNMQVISSLLNMQKKYFLDIRDSELLDETRNRINSMSLVHEQLYQSHDISNINFNDYIKSLTDNLFHFHGIKSNNISLTIDAKEINLDIDAAIPCGLIVNELISNSLKHAFPGQRKGEILISMEETFTKDNVPGKYYLIMKDNGIGLPENLDISKTKSLGLQLVTGLVEHQLKGTVKLIKSGGTEFQISFNKLKYEKKL